MIASIIIPVYNEEKYIEACLDSILLEGVLPKETEIIIVDGMSTDRTADMIRQYQQKYSNIILLENPKRIVPIAMNIGIKEAKGEYIIRLDAHASYPKDYFSKLIAWHQKLDADNVGAVWKTEVFQQTSRSCAIKQVLSHPFGIGDAKFRTGVDQVLEVDTVPFGCYKKEIFKKYGLYDERLVRNQDIELNKRIVRGGGKIYLVPDIQCTYYARETFSALAKNNFANGKWNILTAYFTKTFNSLSMRHFVPLLFVSSLIIPFLLSFFISNILMISMVSLVSYLALVIIISFKQRRKNYRLHELIWGFCVLHISYGAGSIVGILSASIKYIKGEK